MLMPFIIFGFFAAGLSVYAFFIIDEVGWKPAGARNGNETLHGEEPAEAKMMEPELAETAVANDSADPVDCEFQIEIPSVSVKFEFADEAEIEIVDDPFQWGELTLRELEARPVENILEELNSEAWQRET